MPRIRIDSLLSERGLFPSRSRAAASVIAGEVLVLPDRRRAEKPGQLVDEQTQFELVSGRAFVSRGGVKLANALDALGLAVGERCALDVGASTGGFTDVLLQRGAARVIALDVGHGQLHPRIRNDDRVIVLERTNARTLEALPFPPQLVTCDVSFISVRAALPSALALAAPGWQALVLVKPQFEAGPADVRKGVVRDAEVRRRVLVEVAEASLGWEARVAGIVDSGLPGPKGNHEFVLHLVHEPRPELPSELQEWIADATH
jgi:23S rRNA (cytidine1920-2'-O)/16S rRNA (cytidine1409-2'-O)-methyltransferase